MRSRLRLDGVIRLDDERRGDSERNGRESDELARGADAAGVSSVSSIDGVALTLHNAV